LTRVADQVTDDQQLLLSNGLMAMIRDKSPKDLTCFRKLVARCCDIAIKDPETSYGPLAFAVHNDEVELARCLLEVGADANRVEDNGKTALHIAVEVRSTELLSLLLKYGAKPDVVNTVDGGSPLRLACAKGQLEAARMLLDASADPNFDENLLPLHSAAGFDRTTVVELLLDRGADIEKSSPDGLTPFLHCVSFGHLETTILLHKRGANTRASTPRGIIALPLACVKGYPAIVKFLLSIGHDASDPGSADGSRPLHLAAEVGHWEIMEILIEAGASLDDKTLNASAQTPLVSAVFGGRADIVRRILEIPGQTANRTHGSIDARPLHVAAFAGHVDVIKELLAGGAEIDAMTTNGMTAMQIAVAKQHLEAADALRASGASLEDVELDDNLLRGCNAQKKYNLLEAIIKHPSTEIPGHVFGGLTWLYVAIYVLPISTLRALLDRGLDPNVAPIIGPGRRQYPLQFAAELNQPEHVQVLLDYGADQSLEDHLGRTAVDLVQQGDDAFSMLSSAFRTSKERLVANVKAFVKGLCDEVLDALGNGSSKTDEAVRDRLESIAVTLLCVAEFHDSARIALEQCISWKETEEGGRVIVHTLDCNVCRALKGIEGVMYVCRESDGLVLCAECFGRYKGLDAGKGDEEGAGKVCRHRAERFFRVPEEEEWEEMDEKGFVCWIGGENEGERMGVSLEEWLVSLASI
jgi:ankyrin repeat protein